MVTGKNALMSVSPFSMVSVIDTAFSKGRDLVRPHDRVVNGIALVARAICGKFEYPCLPFFSELKISGSAFGFGFLGEPRFPNLANLATTQKKSKWALTAGDIVHDQARLPFNDIVLYIFAADLC
jgi:hypothetical protein